MKNSRVLVAGAGGFIGGHLVAALLRQGVPHIRAYDKKPLSEWYQLFPQVENRCGDLSEIDTCREAVANTTDVFNLAADMGGMGFIETHKAECMLSVLINTHLLMAAKHAAVSRYFFSSSACVYNADKQRDADVVALREEDAYPAMAEDGYGWEKLFSERRCRHFAEDFGMTVRVARFHNVYGPYGTYDGGREKAPAAICRKIIEAKLSGRHEIEVWGDGQQTRSFMFIDDCIKGTQLIMNSNCSEPLNLGSDELVSIERLVEIVEGIANIRVGRRYNLDAPKGVRGRNSDNSRISRVIGWAPSTPLEVGLENTYRWIYDEMTQVRPPSISALRPRFIDGAAMHSRSADP